MNKVKHYNGVPMKLVQPKGRVRTLGTDRASVKDGHGCTVQVGMLEFHSLHMAKRFIRMLSK